MYTKREQWILFGVGNGLALGGILLYPLYRYLVAQLPQMICTAVRFGFYCPACGGTRALSALLSLDLVSALRYNLLVPLGALLFVTWDVVAITHLVRGKPRETLMRKSVVLTVTGVVVAYAIIRNLLLLWGIDLIGDIIG